MLLGSEISEKFHSPVQLIFLVQLIADIEELGTLTDSKAVHRCVQFLHLQGEARFHATSVYNAHFSPIFPLFRSNAVEDVLDGNLLYDFPGISYEISLRFHIDILTLLFRRQLLVSTLR